MCAARWCIIGGAAQEFPDEEEKTFDLKQIKMDLAETGSAGGERRPPIYNAEDYILGLKKFSKLTGLQLYLEQNSPLLETNDKVIWMKYMFYYLLVMPNLYFSHSIFKARAQAARSQKGTHC